MSSPRAYATTRFFALRTPLLSIDELIAWTGSANTTASLTESRTRLRAGLARWLERPLVREALFVGSPGLVESLSAWRDSPTSARGQKIERSLVRFFLRMTGRSTPYGLFAAHSVGTWAPRANVELGEALRRATRLDMDYVCALTASVTETPRVARALRYATNSTLYRNGDRWRYLEPRSHGRARTYTLTALEPTPYLDATLERARMPATLDTLAAALVEPGEVDLDEALEFVTSLVSEKVLLPAWEPSLTGADPVTHLVSTGRDIPELASTCAALARAQDRLAALDRTVTGAPPEHYHAVAAELAALPAPIDLAKLVQVDLFRPAPSVELPTRVCDEILRGVHVLRRLSEIREPPLAPMVEWFEGRYGDREVSLGCFLDDDSGMPPEPTLRRQGDLLANMVFPTAEPSSATRPVPGEAHLLRRLERCWRAGSSVLQLDDTDLAALPAAAPMPDLLCVYAAVAARDAAAIDAGEFEVFLPSVSPRPASYLGRFAQNDPELERYLSELVQRDDAAAPEAISAEIVHLPMERIGNVVLRPRLREHEIVFLGGSTAPLEQQIPIRDLFVSVRRGRFVLRSRRLDREIRPRLSCAHNFARWGLRLYRFLALLQDQDAEGFSFSWGRLGEASRLPRLQYGRVVFARARWRIGADDLDAWRRLDEDARFAAVRTYCEANAVPRWVRVGDADVFVPIDLANPLCVDAMLAEWRRGEAGVLEELFPAPDQQPFRVAGAPHAHELFVPFVRAEPALVTTTMIRPRSADGSRTLAPGSEWLYAKLYGGPATLERLLSDDLGEVIEELSASGLVDRWHFVRYSDPDHHLRLRFHGEPRVLQEQVWPQLGKALRSALERGAAWRMQLDTFEREMERYGGPHAIEHVEEIFGGDSDAQLALLRALPADDLRWKLAAKGVDLLLEDLGLSVTERLLGMERQAEIFLREHRLTGESSAQVGARFRTEQAGLTALLAATEPNDDYPEKAVLAFSQRSVRVRTAATHLRRLDAEGRLNQSLVSLAPSLIHMSLNRAFPHDARAHEAVLYDFLARLYRTRARTVRG